MKNNVLKKDELTNFMLLHATFVFLYSKYICKYVWRYIYEIIIIQENKYRI